ncbi:hypothetical protein SAMN04515674_10635 [Pseudarcicella hirudinis]|uniref:Tetratricopeptide repeat-containing protein n=1 Tax=Pseudarcicella hirudinis TaxID=1079859 RepID=A0A1I5THY7_9BACT|nr:hypothetical protein [Pseudarcicella hirudinis]SFP82006.1 hypothetical protein SAMN04515674_10635 [Pseudarcicella hirudinis]
MKKLIFLLAACLITWATRAQSDRYTTAMLHNIALIDSARTVAEFHKYYHNFQRIGDAEKKEWLPYYYAAFCEVSAAYEEKDVSKIDGYCDKASALLDHADSLSPQNAEIYCLRAMVCTARIEVDFMKRGMEMVTQSRTYLEKALSFDAKNPRAYYLLGQNLYNIPSAFGGGKQKAAPFFEKALTIYEEKKASEQEITVHWGRPLAKQMTELCKNIKGK